MNIKENLEIVMKFKLMQIRDVRRTHCFIKESNCVLHNIQKKKIKDETRLEKFKNLLKQYVKENIN